MLTFLVHILEPLLRDFWRALTKTYYFPTDVSGYESYDPTSDVPRVENFFIYRKNQNVSLQGRDLAFVKGFQELYIWVLFLQNLTTPMELPVNPILSADMYVGYWVLGFQPQAHISHSQK